MRPLRFKAYQDKADEWRWALVSGNGKTIADSGEGYRHKGDCLRAIALMKRAVYGAKVEVQHTNELPARRNQVLGDILRANRLIR